MRDRRGFSEAPESAAAARQFVRRAVAGLPPDTVDAIELMVSELATNCIRHTQTEFELILERTPQGVRIEVADRGRGAPQMRSPTIDEPTGRGLRIVEMLSDAWGVEFAPQGGKTVWFTLAAATAAGVSDESAAARC